MTKEEIIEMAKQAGWEMDDSLVLEPEIVWYISQGQLEAFAKLVAEKERESLRPRCWTQKMNDAWNKAIPDLTLAFDELIKARKQE